MTQYCWQEWQSYRTSMLITSTPQIYAAVCCAYAAKICGLAIVMCHMSIYIRCSGLCLRCCVRLVRQYNVPGADIRCRVLCLRCSALRTRDNNVPSVDLRYIMLCLCYCVRQARQMMCLVSTYAAVCRFAYDAAPGSLARYIVWYTLPCSVPALLHLTTLRCASFYCTLQCAVPALLCISALLAKASNDIYRI